MNTNYKCELHCTLGGMNAIVMFTHFSIVVRILIGNECGSVCYIVCQSAKCVSWGVGHCSPFLWHHILHIFISPSSEIVLSHSLYDTSHWYHDTFLFLQGEVNDDHVRYTKKTCQLKSNINVSPVKALSTKYLQCAEWTRYLPLANEITWLFDAGLSTHKLSNRLVVTRSWNFKMRQY